MIFLNTLLANFAISLGTCTTILSSTNRIFEVLFSGKWAVIAFCASAITSELHGRLVLDIGRMIGLVLIGAGGNEVLIEAVTSMPLMLCWVIRLELLVQRQNLFRHRMALSRPNYCVAGLFAVNAEVRICPGQVQSNPILLVLKIYSMGSLGQSHCNK